MDLKTKTIKSAAWLTIARLFSQAVSWLVTLVLARLLTPADYGVFAIALGVISFLELFHEFGLGAAIVQCRDLTKIQLNTIFWIISGSSLAIVILTLVAAGILAQFYDEPQLLWILPILSLVFLVNSLGLVSQSLLTKEINFRDRAIAEALGVVGAASVSFVVAYQGYGVWALVSGHLARATLRSAALSAFCGWLPGLRVSFSQVKGIINFGLTVAGSNAVNEISHFVNVSIVARFLGTFNLGLYTVSDSVGRMNPLNRFSTSVINQLAFPVFAKLQHEQEQLQEYFLKIAKYTAVISLPLQVGFFLVAHDAVLVLFGEKWLGLVEVLRIFALGGIWTILPLSSPPLLTAKGKATIFFNYTCLSSLAMIVACLIGVQWGLDGVMCAWLGVTVVARSILLWLGLREIALTIREYLATIWPSLFSSGVMVVAVLLSQAAIDAQLLPVQHLIIHSSMGAVVYISLVALTDRSFRLEVRSILRDVLVPSRA